MPGGYRPGGGDLAGGIDRQSPVLIRVAVGLQRAADEGALRHGTEQVVERPQTTPLDDVPREGMVEYDQIEVARELLHRRELEAVQGARRPFDADVRVLAIERRQRSEQGIDGAPMSPGDAPQRDPSQ